MRSIGLSIGLLFSLLAYGQDTSTPKTLIPLFVTDTSRHHQPVASLTPAALAVTDNRVTITAPSLLTGGTLPLELGVLIDTSNSEGASRTFAAALKAASDFVMDSLRTGDDRVFSEPFDAKPHMTAWLKKEDFGRAPLQLRVGGGTALYDAIAAACTERMSNRDWKKPTRRVLIVISDGDDNLSSITRGEAVSFAVAKGVVIFAVGTRPAPLGRGRGEKILEAITEATGGRAFVGLSEAEVPQVFARIRALMEGIYYLSYVPPEPDKVADHELVIKPALGSKFQLSYPSKYPWNP